MQAAARPQHRHLCATAAATRSIINSESLPLTPLSYFAATINAIFETSKSLDADAVSALSAFLSIVLPLIPENAIAPEKAVNAVEVLSELAQQSGEAVSASSVRWVVKCIGVLVGFCDLEDCESAKLGFEILLKFSIDKRPKVRKCAQDCVVKVFKSFKSSSVIKKASKSVFSMLKSYTPLLVKLTTSKPGKGPKEYILSKPEHQEVLHMLNVLKHYIPYLHAKFDLKLLSEIQTLMKSKYSPLTRHIFDVIEAMFEATNAEVLASEAENTIKSLVSYVSSRKNPADTVLSAACLLKSALNILRDGDPIKWSGYFSSVVGSVAGLLTSDASTASQASNIIKELIENHMDKSNVKIDETLPDSDGDAAKLESSAVDSISTVLVNLLNSCEEIPNEHILAIISVLFLKLGEVSYVYMKDILLKLAEFMNVATPNNSNGKNLQECIGSAVAAIGPEKVLELLPISFNEENLECSNIWLLPILKKNVVGSSLGFFMDHVVPLAESFERACREAKKSTISQNMQSHARSCWGLLPTFCHQPTDTGKKFRSLAKLLIPLLRRDSFMVENIYIALQVLVNQNKSVHEPDLGDEHKNFDNKPSYSKKVASKNLKVLASCSEELLLVLRDVLFESHREKHSYLKDTIRCVASIADSSVVSDIFISSLEKYQPKNDLDKSGNSEIDADSSTDKDESNSEAVGNDAKRFLILEIASSIVDVANEDLINQIFNFIKHNLQETDEIGQREAYITLNKILKKDSSFCNSKLEELMDLLLAVKSPVDVSALKSRFTCFEILLIRAIENSDEENTKAFLILNEVILTLKDSTEEGRKVAYDVLLKIGSTLKESSSSISTSDGPYYKLIGMIMGYTSGSSPHIRSGAVSALSILVHNDVNLCNLMPDLVPAVLELLESKAIEVIKAVLGFIKVLALSSQARDLHNNLTEIVNRILPWSSVSRNHFKAKVTVILEILMRKCGSTNVKSIAPEKFKDFVKEVLENRQGKSSSKEGGPTETESKPSDSSSSRQPIKESGISKENNRVGPTKRRDDNSKEFPKRSRPIKKFGDKPAADGQRDGNDRRRNQGANRRNPRKFNGDRSNAKRKRSEGAVDGNTTAFPKRKKAWKKQKIEKMKNAAS